jgi:glutaredoxin
MAEAKEILGSVCARCPATEDLQIDHRDWRRKTMTAARMTMVGRERFLEELAQCQLLCPPCHREKSKDDLREILAARGKRSFNVLPEEAYRHGTPRMALYRKCRCDWCKEARRLYKSRLIGIDGCTTGE